MLHIVLCKFDKWFFPVSETKYCKFPITKWKVEHVDLTELTKSNSKRLIWTFEIELTNEVRKLRNENFMIRVNVLRSLIMLLLNIWPHGIFATDKI
jgi:hypothetical protein